MSEHLHELPHGATPDYLTELHGAIAEQAVAVAKLERAIDALLNRAAWPFRDAAISNDPRLVAAGPIKLTYLHATNELGAADAYLHFFDEISIDNVKLGQSKPDNSFWLPAGGGLADPWVPPEGFRRGCVIVATSSRDGAGAPDHTILVTLLMEPLREERPR